MPHPNGFKPLPPIGAVMYGVVSPVDDAVFYPEVLHRGLRVEPLSWHPESREPLLKCRLDSSRVSESITEFKDLAKRQREYDEWVRTLKADGWSWDQREGGQKYVHVDELEKIEGPPPDGPF